MPATPASCAVLRSTLRDWIAGLGCPHDVSDNVVMAANEAFSMVIEHADRRPNAPHILISAACVHDSNERSRIAITIKQFGRWRLTEVEPIPDHHDLNIMQACMDVVDVGADGDGTCFTLISAPL